jgi:F0F1-type ATP synthase alpha subunit
MYSVLYAANNGAFDTVPLEKIEVAREALLRELKSKHAKLTDELNTGNKPTDEQNEQVMKVAQNVARTYEVKKAEK